MRILVDPNGQHMLIAIKSAVGGSVKCCIICGEDDVIDARGFKTKVIPTDKLEAKSPLEADAHRQDLLITRDFSIAERCAPRGTRIMDYDGNLYFCNPGSRVVHVKRAQNGIIETIFNHKMLPARGREEAAATFKNGLSQFVRTHLAEVAAKKKAEKSANIKRAKEMRNQQRLERAQNAGSGEHEEKRLPRKHSGKRHADYEVSE
jgi:uncharacterized protein YaiI (UPF0178 family)